jgi:hypothetical protein
VSRFEKTLIVALEMSEPGIKCRWLDEAPKESYWSTGLKAQTAPSVCAGVKSNGTETGSVRQAWAATPNHTHACHIVDLKYLMGGSIRGEPFGGLEPGNGLVRRRWMHAKIPSSACICEKDGTKKTYMGTHQLECSLHRRDLKSCRLGGPMQTGLDEAFS